MTATEWESGNAKTLDNPALKKGLKLLWFATGKDDGLMTTTSRRWTLFKKHGFNPVFKRVPGGHTWINWRELPGRVHAAALSVITRQAHDSPALRFPTVVNCRFASADLESIAAGVVIVSARVRTGTFVQHRRPTDRTRHKPTYLPLYG